MDTFDGRLAQAMKLRELEPKDLYLPGPNRVLSKAAIYWLLDGTTTRAAVRDTTVAKLCKVLRLNRSWLTEGKGPRDSEPSKNVHKHDSTTVIKARTASHLGRISERTLADAEHLLAAWESVHGKLSAKARTHQLTKIYNMLFDDGGKLSDAHLAALNLEVPTGGARRSRKPTG